MLIKAIEFAFKKHQGQTRKGSKIPYITHPLAVMGYVMAEDAPENVAIAALLHDVLEDTEGSYQGSYNEIVEYFGEEVARLVQNVAEPEGLKKSKDQKGTWKERKKHTIDHLNKADTYTKMIVCADKLHNAICIREDLAVGIDAWSKFNAPKEDVAWYYNSILDSLKELEGTRIYKLLKIEVRTLFEDV